DDPHRPAQQGLAVRGRLRDPPRGGLPPAPRHQGARARRRRQRRRVLLPAPPRHRPLRRRGHARRRRDRSRPAARLRGQGRGGHEPGLRPVPLPLRRSGRALLLARGAGRAADRDVVRRGGRGLPLPPRDRRDRDAARRSRRDEHPARGRRRHRRRRRDRVHPASGRARRVRRGDPRLRGGAHHPRRRGARGVRGVPASHRGGPRRTELRDDGLRHRGVQPRRRDRSRTRPGGPDDLAAGQGGLGRRAGDGAAGGVPAADGRALVARCACHPADRHPCLPPL
ncbi:MAG: ATP phosphoribosyltransferase _ HisGl, partial [uncultured Nocardioides sp.]